MALEDLALEDMVAVTATWTDRSHSDYQTLAKRPITHLLLQDIDASHQAVAHALQARSARMPSEPHASRAADATEQKAREQWLSMMIEVRIVAEVLAADDEMLRAMLDRVEAAGERAEEHRAAIPMGRRAGTDPGFLRASGARPRAHAMAQSSRASSQG